MMAMFDFAGYQGFVFEKAINQLYLMNGFMGQKIWDVQEEMRNIRATFAREIRLRLLAEKTMQQMQEELQQLRQVNVCSTWRFLFVPCCCGCGSFMFRGCCWERNPLQVQMF